MNITGVVICCLTCDDGVMIHSRFDFKTTGVATPIVSLSDNTNYAISMNYKCNILTIIYYTGYRETAMRKRLPLYWHISEIRPTSLAFTRTTSVISVSAHQRQIIVNYIINFLSNIENHTLSTRDGQEQIQCITMKQQHVSLTIWCQPMVAVIKLVGWYIKWELWNFKILKKRILHKQKKQKHKSRNHHHHSKNLSLHMDGVGNKFVTNLRKHQSQIWIQRVYQMIWEIIVKYNQKDVELLLLLIIHLQH